MAKYLAAYGATALTFIVVDLVWLGLIARSFYRERMGALLADEFNTGAALLFYGLYMAGVVVFVVTPALQTGSLRTAILYGAAFGLVAYGTYDLTNLATLRGWPVAVAVVDMAWGAVATAVSAAAAVLASRIVG